RHRKIGDDELFLSIDVVSGYRIGNRGLGLGIAPRWRDQAQLSVRVVVPGVVVNLRRDLDGAIVCGRLDAENAEGLIEKSFFVVRDRDDVADLLSKSFDAGVELDVAVAAQRAIEEELQRARCLVERGKACRDERSGDLLARALDILRVDERQ